MILSDRDLRNAIKKGDLVIDPYEPELVQPASIDVRLDRFFRVFPLWADPRKPEKRLGPLVEPLGPTVINPAVRQENLTYLVEKKFDESFQLEPGQFVLASTLETIRLSASLAARIEGKSSLGRLGLLVHSTAGFVDPGFMGTLTLELTNVAPLPILLWPGTKIGQLCVMKLTSPAETPYGWHTGAHYQGQRGPTESRSWMKAGPGHDTSGEGGGAVA